MVVVQVHQLSQLASSIIVSNFPPVEPAKDTEAESREPNNSDDLERQQEPFQATNPGPVATVAQERAPADSSTTVAMDSSSLKGKGERRGKRDDEEKKQPPQNPGISIAFGRQYVPWYCSFLHRLAN